MTRKGEGARESRALATDDGFNQESALGQEVRWDKGVKR